jgi:hypothetical protein
MQKDVHLLLSRCEPVECAAIAGEGIVIFVSHSLSICCSQSTGSKALQ